MLGHPAKYNTAAYEKQNARGAHVTLEMGIQRPCDSGSIIIVIIIILPVPPRSYVCRRSNGAPCRRRKRKATGLGAGGEGESH